MINHLVPVKFYGDTIYYLEKDGEMFVPMRPIIENMGIDWKGQHAKLVSAQNRWSVEMISTVAQDGRQREVVCIPFRKLAGFLATINPDKVREELREKLLRYQNECDDVLNQYWTTGRIRTRDNSPAYTLKDRLDAARLLFETAHLEGNQLALAVDKIHRREVGYSALEASGIALASPRQELALTPTQIGELLNPVLPPAKVNSLLANAGYQKKVAKQWEALPKASGMYVMLDTNKRHSDGTPVQQLKWYRSIATIVQQLADKRAS